MGRIRDLSNFIILSIDQIEQLKYLRKEANISMSQICRLMGCSTCKIHKLEQGKSKVDSDFYHKLLKKYELLIKNK